PRGALDPTTTPPSGNETAVYLLDRVVDDWGNFYDIHYNNDLSNFTTRGIRVTKIDYTGHLQPEDNNVDVQPFHSIQFEYLDDRPDVRWTRFGNTRIPMNGKLWQIRTPLGRYLLQYQDDNVALPTRLEQIDYCTGPIESETCLE